MDALTSRQYVLGAGLLVGAVAVFQVLVLFNAQLALLLGVAVCVTPPILYLASRDVSSLTVLVLLILPFHAAPVVSDNLFGVQGMKPFNLLTAMAIAAAPLSRGFFKLTDRTDKLVLAGFGAFFTVWTLTFLRSLPNSVAFHYLDPVTFQRSTADYILSFYVKPSLYLATFYVVYRLARSDRAIERFSRALGVSSFVLAVVILYAAMANLGLLAGGRGQLSSVFSAHLGMIYNSIGTMFVLTGPLLLLLAIQRKGFWTANYVLAVAALLLLGSRTSLVVFGFSSLLLLLLLGYIRLALTGLVVGIAVVAAFSASPTVSALFSVGIDSGHIVSLDQLLAKRQTLIWIPLLLEWWQQPQKLWFGAGLFGILTTDGVPLGGIAHAHNGLLDFFLDCGILITGAFVVFLTWGIVKAWRVGRRLGDPLYWALFSCFAAYLVSTLTGRGFFPRFDNVQLFPILALMIAHARLHLSAARGREPGASRLRAAQPGWSPAGIDPGAGNSLRANLRPGRRSFPASGAGISVADAPAWPGSGTA